MNRRKRLLLGEWHLKSQAGPQGSAFFILKKQPPFLAAVGDFLLFLIFFSLTIPAEPDRS
jgi:hypothetical protein